MADGLTASTHAHKHIPDHLAFMLNNPLRRKLSHPNRLISTLEIKPKDVVVDFGCGPGFFLIPLAGVAAKVIGIDVSTRMLDRASSYAKKNSVSVDLLQSDGTDIKLQDGSVDLILLVHVFHEVEDEQGLLREFLRILRPSGRLAIVEKTRPSRVLPASLGPPIVEEKRVVEEVQRAGLTSDRTIPYGKDSIIISRK